jgi:hypothetical protein
MTATVHAFTPARGYKKATTAEIKKALQKEFAPTKFSVRRPLCGAAGRDSAAVRKIAGKNRYSFLLTCSERWTII